MIYALVRRLRRHESPSPSATSQCHADESPGAVVRQPQPSLGVAPLSGGVVVGSVASRDGTSGCATSSR